MKYYSGLGFALGSALANFEFSRIPRKSQIFREKPVFLFPLPFPNFIVYPTYLLIIKFIIATYL